MGNMQKINMDIKNIIYYYNIQYNLLHIYIYICNSILSYLKYNTSLFK